MKIGIIGNGVVGSATGAAFESHVNEVRYYDTDLNRRTHLCSAVLDCDIVFVCLPTPQKVNALGCNTDIVEDFLGAVSKTREDWRKVNLVLRSTVPVGFTRMLREKYGLVNLVHSPEFLTARTAEEDAKNPTRLLIGDPTFEANHCSWKGTGCFTKLLGTYRRIWKTLPIHGMTSDESEAVKLMQNSYSAVVLSLLNEFRTLSDKRGMDWERVMSALLAGGWLAPHHTKVPGPDGKCGFGGACLPKDLNNLIACMHAEHLHAFVMEAASMRNSHIDRKE